MIKFLDIQKQYESIKSEIDEAVSLVFKEGDFIKGRAVKEFESSFAKYCEAGYCVSCGNGTDALAALIKCLDLIEGSTVIVPANTFIATAEAVISNRLNVKFADIDEDYTISPESVESIITEDVSAVVAVHLYGNPAKIAELKKITEKWNIPLVEDAAQAHGAMIGNVRTGSLADGAVFSFYPGKVLGAAGDAGAVVLNDEDLASKVRKYCDHGRIEKYLHETAGINSRMDSVQAAVLNVKLKYLDGWIEKREQVARLYFDLLKDVPDIILPKVRENVRHAWHLFVIRHHKRFELINYLKEKGIDSGIHYPIALPEQPAFKEHLSYAKDFKAVKYSTDLISLPMGEHLSEKDVIKITEVLKKFS